MCKPAEISGLATIRVVKLPLWTLYVGVRDGLAFADTRREAVIEFVNGKTSDAPADSFVDSADFQRLPQDGDLRAGRTDLLVHLNLRPFVQMLYGVMESEVPGFYHAPGPEHVRVRDRDGPTGRASASGLS